jgi:hypothetical protein
MKKFAIIRKDRTILVKTPVPYVVDAFKDSSDANIQDVRYGLDEHTKFLYNCLKMLGISRKEAILKGYTLNIFTGEALNDIAYKNPKISSEMRTVIFNHKW